MRLLGITGDASGRTFLTSGKAPESQTVEANVYLSYLPYFEDIKPGLREAALSGTSRSDLQPELRYSAFQGTDVPVYLLLNQAWGDVLHRDHALRSDLSSTGSC